LLRAISAFSKEGLCGKANHAFFYRGLPSSTSPKRSTHWPNAGRAEKSFFSVANHFAAPRSAIDAGQILFHSRCEQRDVRNFAEIFGDEPDRFFCCHPVQMIESRESFIQRKHVLPKGSVTLANQFTPEVIRAG
jgi:hypothetical protein